MTQTTPSTYATVEESLRTIGERLQQLRIRKRLTQSELALKSDVSLRTVRSLELGKGGNLNSFVRVLRALDAMPQLDVIAPPPRFSPMAALRLGRPPKRVRKSLAP